MSDYRLVYYSANRLTGPDDEVLTQVKQILDASRRNNTLVDVTGALMFSKSYFGQVLEGPRGAIEVTFERIQQDGRHGDVALLDFAPIAARSFDRWSMAFVGATSSSSAALDAIGQMTGFDPDHLRAERLFEKLRDLVTSPALVVL
jgi:FAD-dependent sensor of blue light